MRLISSFEDIGEYVLLMKETLALPDRFREFFKELVKETYKLGVNSIWLVMIISFFIGAVMVMQIAVNLVVPFLPGFTIGFVSREIILLEMSSTMLCLLLAGKVGSNIASEIGTMRITEQIDALQIMGVNAPNYLILPKITAFVFFMPVLVVFSMFLALVGGYAICVLTRTPTVEMYIYGLQFYFKEYFIWTSIAKSMIYGFIIASVSAFHGYRVKGGATEVGMASTNSIVINNILILLTDLMFTQLVMA